jgi:hypothetical protein
MVLFMPKCQLKHNSQITIKTVHKNKTFWIYCGKWCHSLGFQADVYYLMTASSPNCTASNGTMVSE